MLKKGRIAFASTFFMLLAALVAACGGGGTGTPTNPGNPNAYHYTQPTTKGGTILYSDWECPESTNPMFNTSVTGTEVANALWAGPFVVSSDGKFLPDQLTEIPTQANGDVSSDGLTVTMKLKPDLKWSDGQPLTSDDFIYWWKTLLDPQTGAASTTGYDKDTVASMTAPDPHTVVIKYVKPFASYLFFLPGAAPKHVWGSIPDKDLINTPEVNIAPKVTSGPFVIQDFASGQSFTMVPNTNYTSTSLHPTVLDKLVFKCYASKDALIAGYQAGETDHAEDFTLADLQKLNGLPGLHVAKAIGYEHVDFNLQNPVLQDINVRKAVEQAIDRCKLITSLLHEKCSDLAVDELEPPPHPDADPSIKELPFDLNAAKADMQAAGWTINGSNSPATKDGKPFPTLNLVTTSGNPLRQNTIELIKGALAQIGIPVNIDGQLYPAGTLFGDFASGGILATGKYDLALFAYVEGLDSDGNLYGSFHSTQIPTAQDPAGGNYSRVNDPKVDQLLDQGRTTIDVAKRSQIYKDLQKYIVQQVYTIPLYLRPNITLTDAKIGNYFDNPTSQGNPWNVGEWYVKQAAQ